jgi:small-conductance mechanosensitive channel
VPYLVPVVPRDALARFLGDGLKIVWWFWAASMASEALRLYASRGHTPLSRYRLSQDLSVAAIYICALIGLTTFVLNLPLQGLLVTSGAVAVVLGLALQSTLGDVIYGIVLSLGKPYNLGDWVALDNGVEGIVVEMNWRATNLLTDRQDIAIVPNSVIAKARIVNSSFPSRTHGTCIRLPLAPQTSPELATRVLSDAALGCRLVLTQPPPSIVVKSMSAEATTFEVTFFTADVGLAQNAQTIVYENIFRALKVAGLALGSTNASASAAKIASDFVASPELQRLLDSSGLFNHLDHDARVRLADQLERAEFAAGDIVLSQGSVVPALLLVGSGVISVTRRSGERVDEVTRLSAGGCFGAEEIRKAMPSAASLTVVRRSTVYRLDKAAFLRISDGDIATPAAVEAAE